MQSIAFRLMTKLKQLNVTLPELVVRRFETVNSLAGRPREGIQYEAKAPTVSRTSPGGNVIVNRLWGLIPNWTRPQDFYPLAKAETILERLTFRDAFASRRCLVPANGIYFTQGKKSYFARLRSGALFAMAGIADVNTTMTSSIHSFCILTVPANSLIEDIGG